MQWTRYSNPMTRTTATRDMIVESIAELIWTDAWARREEEKPSFEGFGGAELMDIAPRPPRHAHNAAKKIATAIETMNNLSLDGIWAVAVAADGGLRKDNTPKYFGHDLGFMVLGHGVSWYDDHEKFIVPTTGNELKFPHVEYDAGGFLSGV